MKQKLKIFSNSAFFALLIAFTIISSNLFAQWTSVGTLSSPWIWKKISVVDSNIVWVCGNNRVWRTVNGGANWKSTNVPNTTNWFGIICAKDSLTAFLGDNGNNGTSGGNANIFKTTNGGNNWIFIDSTGGNYGWISGIVYAKTNPDFVLIVSDPPLGPGNPFWTKKSYDGGQTWISGSIPEVYNALTIGGLFCIDSLLYGFIIENSNADSARAYFTTNGGLNWNVRGTSPPYGTGIAGYCDFNIDKNIGIYTVSSMTPKIAKTTNGGLNWVLVNTGIEGTGNAVISWVSGTNKLFLLVQSSNQNKFVYRSDDNGLTWISQSTPSGMQFVINASFIKIQSKIIGYAITTAGQVWKTIQDTMSVGIKSISQEIPAEYKLYQNYPNPFNQCTMFKFQLPVDSRVHGNDNVVLKVFDLLGKKVATLVNEKLQPGTYEVTFDAAELPSGVYFYKLTAGEFTDTKRMILIK